MHLSFKSVWNKEHKGVICNMTSSSNSFQSTQRVGWEELLVLSRFLVITSLRVEFLSPAISCTTSLFVLGEDLDDAENDQDWQFVTLGDQVRES